MKKNNTIHDSINGLRIAVIGAGSWGTTIAIHLFKKGNNVLVWEFDPNRVLQINQTRTNDLLPGISIPEGIIFSNDLNDVINNIDLIVAAIPSHVMRKVFREINKLTVSNEPLIVNLSKGIEVNTLKRMSEVIDEELYFPHKPVCTLHGPSHAEEVSRGIPTAIVAACPNIEIAEHIQKIFMGNNLRVYSHDDIVGVELGGALKNVIAIAAGICDGVGFGDNTKAALITRGVFEIGRLGTHLGAEKLTFTGLSGIGDLIVTCLSRHSRNRYVGEEIGKGKTLDEILGSMKMVAEGVNTTRSAVQLSEKHNIPMPITLEVYNVLFDGKNPLNAVSDLMSRDPVPEWHSMNEAPNY
jgi:glycerol-3-phosphate dehydrogenase (NAD(P)+)